MDKLVISCDDGDIVLDVDYDKPGHIANLAALDLDLKEIESGKLDWLYPATADEDCEWETPRGKMIGELFARIDAGEEV